MRVLLSGSSGLIGKALIAALHDGGHETVRLVRRSVRADDEIAWDPNGGSLDANAFDGVDAVVNLSGAGIGDRRWTEAYKQVLLDSRVKSTALLADTMATLPEKPSVFLSGSAVGIYGNRGTETLTEQSAPGVGFFPSLVQQWEAAAEPAAAAGIRTVLLRTGVVYSPRGGALRKLLPPFKMGLGGKFGSGKQFQSWVSIDDAIKAMLFLMETDISGPVNIATPNPVTNAEIARTLGRVLRRPAILPIPRFAPSLLMGGELVQNLLFDSQRVVPEVLDKSPGFRFDYPDFELALRAVLDR